MKKDISSKIFNLAHLFLLLIFACFLLPSKYKIQMRESLKSPVVFSIALLIIELIFIYKMRDEKKLRAAKDIFAILYGTLFVWELFVSRLNVFPYVFVPAPENVFYVFVKDYAMIAKGFCSSMVMLAIGMSASIIAAVILGTLVGWNKRLTSALYPVAKAISTVPPLVYTPYVALIMPTFAMASLFLIFLSVFWGTFMGAINNTAFVEKKIVNAAKVLNLPTPVILFKIIIPFNLPRILNSLPIQLATAVMTLTVAEMMGANSGMGYYVRFSLSFANYTKAIAGIIFLGIVVSVLNGLIDFASKKIIKWKY